MAEKDRSQEDAAYAKSLARETITPPVPPHMIDNLIMPHTWNELDDGSSVCLRCGVRAPTTEGCP